MKRTRWRSASTRRRCASFKPAEMVISNREQTHVAEEQEVQREREVEVL